MQGRFFILKKRETSKSFYSAKVITVSGLLTAASVILATLAKYFQLFEGSARLTFESLPIFIGAFAFGPIVGGAIAIGADLISCVITGMPVNLLITIGACYTGVVSGVIYKYCFKKRFKAARITAAVFAGHIIGSMMIKSLALHLFFRFGIILLLRIPIYTLVATVESIVLSILFKNKALKNEITGDSHDLR